MSVSVNNENEREILILNLNHCLDQCEDKGKRDCIIHAINTMLDIANRTDVSARQVLDLAGMIEMFALASAKNARFRFLPELAKNVSAYNSAKEAATDAASPGHTMNGN